MSKKKYAVIHFGNGSVLHLDIEGARESFSGVNLQNLPRDPDAPESKAPYRFVTADDLGNVHDAEPPRPEPITFPAELLEDRPGFHFPVIPAKLNRTHDLAIQVPGGYHFRAGDLLTAGGVDYLIQQSGNYTATHTAGGVVLARLGHLRPC